MKAKHLCLAIPLCLLLSLAMSGTASAATSVEVEWSSPNPDTYVCGSIGHTSAWASVVGSGGVASGKIGYISGHYHDLTTAYQTASFTGGDYTTMVGASRPDYPNSIIHAFEVRGADSSSVEQEAGSMPSYAQVEGWQTYSAKGADLVIAGGSVERNFWTWDTPQRVSYTGNAYGDVTGSQRSWTNCIASGEDWNSPGLGFGAGIQGTEGVTFFGFNINTPTSISIPNHPGPTPGTLHTTVIANAFSIFGESHTWLEDSPLDDDFNWIN